MDDGSHRKFRVNIYQIGKPHIMGIADPPQVPRPRLAARTPARGQQDIDHTPRRLTPRRLRGSGRRRGVAYRVE
jgi:hypothetical protein